MHSTSLLPAYVLHRRRFRETSLVVELLSRDHGRCAVLAKGALNARSSRQQLLQPFVPLLIEWRGRGELPLMINCEAAGSTYPVTGRALYCGLYVNELILALCERHDPHSALFPAYASCVDDLAKASQGNAGLEPVLRRFELALLDELGMGMQLETDLDGVPIDPRRRYHYLPDSGAVPAGNEQQGYSGETLLALAEQRLDTPELRTDARRLMRQVLDSHLGGRQLKSRELFR